MDEHLSNLDYVEMGRQFAAICKRCKARDRVV